jgi:hypothetical protein
MDWKIVAVHYLTAFLGFLLYFIGAWWAGHVFDKDKKINQKKIFLHIIVLTITFIIPTLMVLNLKEENLVREKEIAIKRQTGILESQTKILLPYNERRVTQLEFGWTLTTPGALLVYKGGPLSNFFKITNPSFKILDEIKLSISEKNNQILVSCLVRNESGNVLAQLVNNEW